MTGYWCKKGKNEVVSGEERRVMLEFCPGNGKEIIGNF